MFGNRTGVNMHGDIVLGSDDVATDWLHVNIYFLTCVPPYLLTVNNYSTFVA